MNKQNTVKRMIHILIMYFGKNSSFKLIYFYHEIPIKFIAFPIPFIFIIKQKKIRLLQYLFNKYKNIKK